MNPLEWGRVGLLLAILAYWALAISWWAMRQRHKSRAAEAPSATNISDTQIVVTFEERINVVRIAMVLLGPPLLLVLLWMAGRR